MKRAVLDKGPFLYLTEIAGRMRVGYGIRR